jgi:hypothetical protein
MLETFVSCGARIAFHNGFPGERFSGVRAGYVYPKHSSASSRMKLAYGRRSVGCFSRRERSADM